MKPNFGSLIYEGKAKKVFDSDQENNVIIEFKDDATAFNAKKKSTLEGKGFLNCQISAYLFSLLRDNSIPTHFLELTGDRFMLAQKIEVIPLEIVIRNVATGSLIRETPIKEGTKLETPLLDIYYKDDNLNDPFLSEARIKLLKIVSVEQYGEIERLARKVNEILKNFFERIDLTLVDFKLEMGLNFKGEIVIADEISPDTCRLWDKNASNENDRILDKDRFRKNLGGVVEGYGEILKRIQWCINKASTTSKVSEY